MPLSLTAIIGEKRSRSVKKAAIYVLAFAGSYAFVASVFMAITIWRLATGAQKLLPWRLEGAPGVILLIVLICAPFILWFAVRAWFKYTHNQEAVLEAEAHNKKMWDFVLEHQDEILEKLSNKIVKDRGNYRNDLPEAKFSVTDLRNVAKGKQELEDFEKHS